jgi:addiction module RelE/StbE family toxin
MKNWTVEMTQEAEERLRLDLSDGRITGDDIKVIKRWIEDVETLGLEHARKERSWRDHPLQGEWFGHRDVSFSYAGRIIYRVESEKVIVRVVRVTADHDYRL